MSVRVAINGFGRIGRNVLRALAEAGRKDMEVVAINDLAPVETNAHLLRFDSVHGRFPGEVKVQGDSIDCGTGRIKVLAIKNPGELPWQELGIDIALECTGIFTSKQKASVHLQAGRKTGRGSAPLAMIPTSTGAAKAVGLVLPELAGKLDGVAIRVPTANVSAIDFKFLAGRKTSKDEINGAITRAAQQQLKGILTYTDQKNVSVDFNHDPHSAIFHMDQTKVMDGTLVRVMAWYDNEWGFSNRMVDTAVAMGKVI